VGDRGEPDARGPWNEGGDWELVQAPAFQELQSELAGTRTPAENGGSHNGGMQRSGSQAASRQSASRQTPSSRKLVSKKR